MGLCEGTNCTVIYWTVGLLFLFIILTILWLAYKYRTAKSKLAELNQEYEQIQEENQRLKNVSGQWNG